MTYPPRWDPLILVRTGLTPTALPSSLRAGSPVRVRVGRNIGAVYGPSSSSRQHDAMKWHHQRIHGMCIVAAHGDPSVLWRAITAHYGPLSAHCYRSRTGATHTGCRFVAC